MSELNNNESVNKKRGLGRGLGSLLGEGRAAEEMSSQGKQHDFAGAAAKPGPNQAAAAPISTNIDGKVWQVAIDKLSAGQYQPRKAFEKESLRQLSQSIKENGILQPIIARKVAGGRLEIIAGERRWRAAQSAGLHEVPVLIKNYDNQEALELAIIENIQREDLNPIEEAEGYSRLVTEFKMSQQQVADKVGRDRATVANAIRLLALPNEAKKLIVDGSLSVGHAKVLLSLPDAKMQLDFAKKVINERLSVRRLEKLVSDAQKASAAELKPGIVTDNNVTQRLILGLSDELQKILGTKVNIDYANSKGKIAVHFYSDDELTQIVDRLKQGWQK